jgi:hypothetical protein
MLNQHLTVMARLEYIRNGYSIGHGDEEHRARSTDSRSAAYPAGAFDGGATRLRDYETGGGGLAGQGEDGPGDAVWLDGADDKGQAGPGKR